MSTRLNLSGLSGYDFSGIIQAMVDAYKLPQNRMADKISKLNTQKSAWQEINTKIAAVDKALEKLKDAQTWNATTATTSGTNAYFSITGSGSGIEGNYIVNISKIAQAETVVSRELTDSSLETLMNAVGSYNGDGTSSNWDFTLAVNGEEKTVNVIKTDPNKTAPTLQDVVNSINRANAGVRASLIQSSTGNYRIAFNSSQTGAANSITFTDPNNFLKTIGILDDSGMVSDYTGGLDDPELGGRIQAAQDALLTVNGLTITSSSNTVSGAIAGTTLILNAPGQGTVTVNTDTEKAKSAVKAFVDAYNAAQQTISKHLAYNAASETAGALLGDSSLQSIQAILRQKVGSILSDSGSFKLLSDIGISTLGRSSDLAFDEAKFSSAFTEDPQSVANLFGASYSGIMPAEGQGLANILGDYLKPLTKYGGTLATTTSILEDQIKDLKDRIAELEKKAVNYEESLKLKFSKLESTLSSWGSQSSWLAAQTNALFSYNKDS